MSTCSNFGDKQVYLEINKSLLITIGGIQKFTSNRLGGTGI